MNYIFVYSVDAITPAGEYEMFGMILDHEELRDVINDTKNSGNTLSAVTVAMYDQKGNMVSEKDITHLFAQAN